MTTDPAEAFARAWNGPRESKAIISAYKGAKMNEKIYLEAMEILDELKSRIEEAAILVERTKASKPTRPIAELWQELGMTE